MFLGDVHVRSIRLSSFQAYTQHECFLKAAILCAYLYSIRSTFRPSIYTKAFRVHYGSFLSAVCCEWDRQSANDRMSLCVCENEREVCMASPLYPSNWKREKLSSAAAVALKSRNSSSSSSDNSNLSRYVPRMLYTHTLLFACSPSPSQWHGTAKNQMEHTATTTTTKIISRNAEQKLFAVRTCGLQR